MDLKLFTPLELGDLTLPNRIVMAPLTRNRAHPEGDVPHALNATYYAQRASAGLIISEGTQISPEGKGYIQTPGIYSDEQIAGWKTVTDAVHNAGGRMFAQLWHVGRISHVSLLPNGQPPVAPSPITANSQTFIATGFVDVSEPRALEVDEIARVVADYRKAAENAKAAGFDGVEIHAANGYLLDQFMRDSTNKRDDTYGGTAKNRTRFLAEVFDAVTAVYPSKRVGVRFSPFSGFNDITDSDPVSTFSVAMARANDGAMREIIRLRLARILLSEGDLDAAEKLSGERNVNSYAGEYAELEGDIAAARNDMSTAAEAYRRALDNKVGNAATVQMKLDDLAVDTSGSPSSS